MSKHLIGEAYKVKYDPNKVLPLIETDEPIFLTALLQAKNKRNANQRVYPESVLVRENNKYQDLIIQGNALGELDHPCFDENVDILTVDGWKAISEISDKEIVMTFNVEKNKYEYQQITDKIVEDYKGEMVRLNHKSLNMLVTPNHRFVMKGRSDSIHRDEYDMIQAKDLNNNRKKRFIKSEDNWDGDDYEFFEIGDTKIPTEIFVAFMGIYLSEGHTHGGNDNVKRCEVSISQIKEHNRIKIERLLDKMPYKFGCYETSFGTSNKDLYNYLSKFGKASEKYIPIEIKSLSPKYLKIFMEWMIMGDGTVIETDYGQIKRYFSTSKRLIDDVQEILFKMGIASSIIVQKQKDRFIEGRLIKEENSQDVYRLTLHSTNYIHNDKRHLKISEEDYDGKIYCVEVPNDTIVVRDRQNCNILISGNSRNIVEYKTASHRITKT